MIGIDTDDIDLADRIVTVGMPMRMLIAVRMFAVLVLVVVVVFMLVVFVLVLFMRMFVVRVLG